MDEIDIELAEMDAKIALFIGWLDEQFGADCEQGDYAEGCLSCESAGAIRHLTKLRASLCTPQPISDAL